MSATIATAHINIRGQLEDDFARGGIAEVGTVLLVFVAVPYLQFVVSGVENGEMQCVAMSKTGIVKSSPIVVYSH